MKRNFFLIGLCVAVAITATLTIHKYLTRNHNQVTESAAIQPEPATTTQNQTSEEPAPVAQVQETNLVAVVITNTEPTRVTIGFRSFTMLDNVPTNQVGKP